MNTHSTTSLVQPQPLSAITLLEQDLFRLPPQVPHHGIANTYQNTARIRTGHKDLDNHALLGGLDRGSVVGISAEEDDFGLALGLQTIAYLFAFSPSSSPSAQDGEASSATAEVRAEERERKPKAMIVTTLPGTILLPQLRKALVDACSSAPSATAAPGNTQTQVKNCLQNISIARIFDLEGLDEVLNELSSSVRKDVVLITSMSPLLSNLFSNRERESALLFAGRLGLRLRHLSRRHSQQSPGPLIILLNSTTTTTVSTPAPPDSGFGEEVPERATDSTLRTIFGPAGLQTSGRGTQGRGMRKTETYTQAQPQTQTRTQAHTQAYRHGGSTFGNGTPGYGRGYGHGHGNHLSRGIGGATTTTTVKPAFGQVFAQMVDVHLLCRRLSSSVSLHIASTATSTAGTVRGTQGMMAHGAGGHSGNGYVWVVEVLLDEIGVYHYEENRQGDIHDDEDEIGKGDNKKGGRGRDGIEEDRDGDVKMEEGGNNQEGSSANMYQNKGRGVNESGREQRVRRRSREQRWAICEL
ncbi:hypothetical protein QBC35DRAFT_463973 [Podospora australis]|uniref:Uncharacterized protein n=1 Tax=Podospora australis TaxID=1536484 RepID=A0AAN6WVJ5_9PEZI|nr:hypothetical protein QBC35DRAFT_463973 [Podospora australis]